MAGNKKGFALRIIAVIGLAILLVAITWAGRQLLMGRRPPEAHTAHDPAQHGAGVHVEALDEAQMENLVPSGELRDGVRVVDFEAFRYGFAPEPLVVREGERVRLRMTSRDVKHGLAILAIEFSAVMPVGAVREAEFDAPGQPGAYAIYCNVRCGPGHGNMKGTMVVLPAEFQSRDR